MPKNPNWQRDELILALDLYIRRGRTSPGDRDPEVVEVSRILNLLPFHSTAVREGNFRNPNGVALKIENLRAVDPLRNPLAERKGMSRGGGNDRRIWDEFGGNLDALTKAAALIRASVTELLKAPTDDDEGFPEGRVIEELHRRRERSRKLVQKKLQNVMAAEHELRCEACGFSFVEVYGPDGSMFAECHHTRPLSEVGPTETRLSDLAVLCANCHRMVHRIRPMPSVAELTALILRVAGN